MKRKLIQLEQRLSFQCVIQILKSTTTLFVKGLVSNSFELLYCRTLEFCPQTKKFETPYTESLSYHLFDCCHFSGKGRHSQGDVLRQGS